MKKHFYKTILETKGNEIVGYWSMSAIVRKAFGFMISSTQMTPIDIEISLGFVTFNIYKVKTKL